MAQRILIIDDDRDINEMLGQLLQMDGWEYIKAETGREGLKLAMSRHPDVVVLDMMLPDVDGYQICRQLTRNRETCRIPVIMLSCMCQPSDALEGALCGAFRYLAKPFSPEAVLAGAREAAAWKQGQSNPPLSGHFELTTDSLKSLARMNQMIRDLALLTPLDDANLESVRQAFAHLLKWFAPTDAANPAPAPTPAPLSVDYQIKLPPPGPPNLTVEDYGVYWTFQQTPPDLLTGAQSSLPEKRRNRILSLKRHHPRERRGKQAAAYRHWAAFMALGEMTMIAPPNGTAPETGVQVVKRFRPANLMVPADGTVLPMISPAAEAPPRTIGLLERSLHLFRESPS